MINGRLISVTLSRNSFGQIIDGLIVLADEWRETAVFHETGAFDDGAVIRECEDASEARNMQYIYQELIDSLSGQLRQSVANPIADK